jgi:hypothetical protein
VRPRAFYARPGKSLNHRAFLQGKMVGGGPGRRQLASPPIWPAKRQEVVIPQRVVPPRVQPPAAAPYREPDGLTTATLPAGRRVARDHRHNRRHYRAASFRDRFASYLLRRTRKNPARLGRFPSRRNIKRSLAGRIQSSRIRSVVTQYSAGLLAVVHCCNVQRRTPFPIGASHIGASLQKSAYHAHVPKLRS